MVELKEFLSCVGFNIEFMGFTASSDRNFEKKTILAIIGKNSEWRRCVAPEEFQVVAIMSVYNEADIIVPTIEKLVNEGVLVYVIDNWSDDGTYELVERLVGRGVVGLERFPPDGPVSYYEWERILQRKEELAQTIKADWFMHVDADEIHRAPWQGMRLKDAIWNVDQSGFNAIDFTVVQFHPVDDNFVPGSDFERYFLHWDFGRHPADFLQIRAWKNTGRRVNLSRSGGHEVTFAGRRVYPYKFLLKHYPIRGQRHGEKKVFRERKSRYLFQERAKGWHTHYDAITPGHSFISDPKRLLVWDEKLFYEEFLVERLSGIGICRTAKSRSIYNKKDSHYAFSRPEVRALVPLECKRVLDVGCGKGDLGAKLKEERRCEVWGVEIQPYVAEEARRKLDRVLAGDYEKLVAELPKEYFDCVIFADVLEHFVDPWEALENTRYILRDGGYVVASVPNVRHWIVIRDLLEGRWEYQEAGILDRAHLRFFTGSSLLKLFQERGFHIEKVQGTVLEGVSVPQEFVQALKSLGIQAGSLSEEGAIYQYLILAKKTLGTSGNLVSLIILTRNNLEYTKLCLESIRKYTPEPHEIIVVDNGSTDGTVEYLKSQPDVRLIENGYNLGFALGNNRGLREARGAYIVFLNNDVVVTEGWLTRLLACAQSDRSIGIVGPRSNYVAGLQRVPSVPYGEDLNAMEQFARAWSLEHAGQWEQVPRVIGFCMLVRREVIERIGGFDPQFGLGNFEDDDFCLRAQLAGFKVCVAHDVFVHHFGSKTFQSEQIDYRNLMEKNWEVFKKKWNLPPEARMERGYVPTLLLTRPFERERDFVPLDFLSLPLDNPKEKKYLAVFTPEVLRWFLTHFTAQDPVTLVLYYPSEEAVTDVRHAIEEAGLCEEETPDILLYPGELPALKIPELVAAADIVLYRDHDTLFLPWAVYLGKNVVKVPEEK